MCLRKGLWGVPVPCHGNVTGELWLQVEVSSPKELSWQVNLYRGYIAICHPEEPHLNMVSIAVRNADPIPTDSCSYGGVVVVYIFWHKPIERAHSFFYFYILLLAFVFVYGPFNCILFHKFSWQLSTFSLCSSGLISALLLFSILYFFFEVSLNGHSQWGTVDTKNKDPSVEIPEL